MKTFSEFGIRRRIDLGQFTGVRFDSGVEDIGKAIPIKNHFKSIMESANIGRKVLEERGITMNVDGTWLNHRTGCCCKVLLSENPIYMDYPNGYTPKDFARYEELKAKCNDIAYVEAIEERLNK